MVLTKKYNISDGTYKGPGTPHRVQLTALERKPGIEHKVKSGSGRRGSENNADTECGIGCWRPRSLQCLAKSLWTFVGFYGLSGLCLAASGFFIRSQMTSMERHFRVSTGKMGILMAANDIGSVASVMLASHFGKFSHIPRLLATLTLLAALFVTAMSLVQAFDPVTLPKVVKESSDDAPDNPIAAILKNPMLLCNTHGPLALIGMMMKNKGGGANMDMTAMMKMMPTGEGAGMDMASMMEKLGNPATAGLPPGMDMSAVMEMMMGNPTGSDTPPGLDMAALMAMIGNSNGNGAPPGMSMKALMGMMRNNTGGGIPPGMDMAALMEMMGNSNGNSPPPGMDMAALMEMMGNSNGNSPPPGMDMAALMEMIGNSNGNSPPPGMDMAALMEMMGNSNGNSPPSGMDMASIMEMMGNYNGNGPPPGMGLKALIEMMRNDTGGGIPPGMDMASIMAMMGNSNGNSPPPGMDIKALMEMMRNNTGGSPPPGMDMAAIMSMMGNYNGNGPPPSLDMAAIMEMMGNSNGNSPPPGMDMKAIMAMMGNPTGGENKMDMAAMMAMMQGSAGAGGNQSVPGQTFDMSSIMGMMSAGYDTSTRWSYYYTFVILIIIGALGSPRMPLQLFYVESNVKNRAESGVKIGTLNTAMMFGNPLALFLGGVIGMMPVDLSDTQMSFLDPRFIGAWWLGFIIFGCASMLFTLPVFCLPKKIRPTIVDGPSKEKRYTRRPSEDKNFALKTSHTQGSYTVSRRYSHRPSNASQVSRLSTTARAGVRAFKGKEDVEICHALWNL